MAITNNGEFRSVEIVKPFHARLGGCILHEPDRRPYGIKLGHFLSSKITVPDSVDYSVKALDEIRDIKGNDSVGDCVVAEDGNYIGVLTANANTEFKYTQAITLREYSALTGYNPSDPNTDTGTDPVVDANYRVRVGYADGSKDLGWCYVDGSKPDEVKWAIANCGNLKMWAALPDAWLSGDVVDGTVWDVGEPNLQNGHCVGSSAYNSSEIVGSNAQGVQIYTWGRIVTVTWAAITKNFTPAYGGGLLVRINADWVSKATGKAPSGFDLHGLVLALNATFNANIPIPAPAPTPPAPTPAPGTAVTLAMAQSWAAAGLSAEHFPIVARATAVADVQTSLAQYWPKS